MLSLDQQNAYRQQYQAQNPGWQPATEAFADAVRERVHPTARVLDLGCGRGGLVEQLSPRPLMVGVDPDMESLASHRLPQLPRAAAFSHALPFENDIFDVVYATWLLEHLDLPEQTLSEVGRVLRPGGVFVFITPNARHPLSTFNRNLGRLGRWQQALVNRAYGRAGGDTFPTRYLANTVEDLQRLARRAGLSLAHLAAIPDPTYLAFTPTLFKLMSRAESYLPADRHIHLVGVMEK